MAGDAVTGGAARHRSEVRARQRYGSAAVARAARAVMAAWRVQCEYAQAVRGSRWQRRA